MIKHFVDPFVAEYSKYKLIFLCGLRKESLLYHNLLFCLICYKSQKFSGRSDSTHGILWGKTDNSEQVIETKRFVRGKKAWV